MTEPKIFRFVIGNGNSCKSNQFVVILAFSFYRLKSQSFLSLLHFLSPGNQPTQLSQNDFNFAKTFDGKSASMTNCPSEASRWDNSAGWFLWKCVSKTRSSNVHFSFMTSSASVDVSTFSKHKKNILKNLQRRTTALTFSLGQVRSWKLYSKRSRELSGELLASLLWCFFSCLKPLNRWSRQTKIDSFVLRCPSLDTLQVLSSISESNLRTKL